MKMNRARLDEIVSSLMYDFEQLKTDKEVLGCADGYLRTQKANIIVKFVWNLCQEIFVTCPDLKERFSLLPYTGKKYHFQKVEMDIPIYDPKLGEPALFLECKDYADSPMAKRFEVDRKLFESGSSKRVGLCVAMQNAMAKETFQDFETDKYFFLFPHKRTSGNQFYVLNYDHQQILKFSVELCKFLYKHLKKQLQISNS